VTFVAQLVITFVPAVRAYALGGLVRIDRNGREAAPIGAALLKDRPLQVVVCRAGLGEFGVVLAHMLVPRHDYMRHRLYPCTERPAVHGLQPVVRVMKQRQYYAWIGALTEGKPGGCEQLPRIPVFLFILAILLFGVVDDLTTSFGVKAHGSTSIAIWLGALFGGLGLWFGSYLTSLDQPIEKTRGMRPGIRRRAQAIVYGRTLPKDLEDVDHLPYPSLVARPGSGTSGASMTLTVGPPATRTSIRRYLRSCSSASMRWSRRTRPAAR